MSEERRWRGKKVGSVVKYILLDMVVLQVLVGHRHCIWKDMSERVTRYPNFVTSVRELPRSLGPRFLNTLFPGSFPCGLIMLSFRDNHMYRNISRSQPWKPEPVGDHCALPVRMVVGRQVR